MITERSKSTVVVHYFHIRAEEGRILEHSSSGSQVRERDRYGARRAETPSGPEQDGGQPYIYRVSDTSEAVVLSSPVN